MSRAEGGRGRSGRQVAVSGFDGLKADCRKGSRILGPFAVSSRLA